MQFVKGERLENCPYQYLDYPKHFLGEDKFTFRSLCWWGHHLVFAMIMDGGLVKQYKKNFVDRFHQLAGQDLELSLAPTLWEWKRGRGLYAAHHARSESPAGGSVVGTFTV